MVCLPEERVKEQWVTSFNWMIEKMREEDKSEITLFNDDDVMKVSARGRWWFWNIWYFLSEKELRPPD